MTSRKDRRTSATGNVHARSFHERIEAERRRIFSAMSIVDCCRCLHECLSAQDGEWPDIVRALAAAHELLDQAAGELGCMADDERARRRR